MDPPHSTAESNETAVVGRICHVPYHVNETSLSFSISTAPQTLSPYFWRIQNI